MVEHTCFMPPFSKEEANFESRPPAGESDCDDCVHWIDQKDGLCSFVQGIIPPEAWCAHWADKAVYTSNEEAVDVQTTRGIEFKREELLKL